MKYHRHKQNSVHKKANAQEHKPAEAYSNQDNIEAYALSTDAKGVAKLEDGSIVFVDDLLPGEKASVKIYAKKSTYKRAAVSTREQDSEHRSKPPCIYYMRCGGCQLQHIKLEKQTDYKIQWFFETLKRIGKWDFEHIQSVQKKISFIYLKADHYRRRIRLHFDGKSLGYKAYESHKIIGIDNCYIARPKLNEKIPSLKSKLHLIYPELQKTFNLSNLEFDIELTESHDEKIVMNIVNINSSSKLTFEQNRKIQEALYKYFEIQSNQLINIKHPQLGKFKLKKESFIQPHFDSLESYYAHISNCVNIFIRLLTAKQNNKHLIKKITAWDLYAGCGVFSCIPYFSAKNFGLESECLAIEGVKESIDSLMLNYKDLPIQGIVQDVYEFIDKQFALLHPTIQQQSPNSLPQTGLADIIILDPPRSGVGVPNMQKIVELCAPKSCVLYLACDPASFARDTRILLDGGFHSKQVFLFDSFGQTIFYEVLGFFTRGV